MDNHYFYIYENIDCSDTIEENDKRKSEKFDISAQSLVFFTKKPLREFMKKVILY